MWGYLDPGKVSRRWSLGFREYWILCKEEVNLLVLLSFGASELGGCMVPVHAMLPSVALGSSGSWQNDRSMCLRSVTKCS